MSLNSYPYWVWYESLPKESGLTVYAPTAQHAISMYCVCDVLEVARFIDGANIYWENGARFLTPDGTVRAMAIV